MSTVPAGGATGVDGTAAISVLFSEDMNPATIPDIVGVRSAGRGKRTGLRPNLLQLGRTRTVLRPSAGLNTSATYTAKVVGGVNGAQRSDRQLDRGRHYLDIHDRHRAPPFSVRDTTVE